MIINVETVAVVKKINPASDITYACSSQSFMKTTGEIVSLVETSDPFEVRMICYNQALDRITTIHNYGEPYK